MKTRDDQDGIRAFIALDLSNEAKDALEEIQSKVGTQTAPGSVRWVKRPAFHLTLVFLGDGVRPEQISLLCETLDQIGRQQQPMTFSLGELGCFPRPGKPRVIWVGIKGDVSRVTALKSDLDQALEPQGWRPEKRPYSPHLTLGRVKKPQGVVDRDLPYGQVLRETTWTVSDINLYRSQLTREGARYTKIHTAPCSGPAKPRN